MPGKQSKQYMDMLGQFRKRGSLNLKAFIDEKVRMQRGARTSSKKCVSRYPSEVLPLVEDWRRLSRPHKQLLKDVMSKLPSHVSALSLTAS